MSYSVHISWNCLVSRVDSNQVTRHIAQRITREFWFTEHCVRAIEQRTHQHIREFASTFRKELAKKIRRGLILRGYALTIVPAFHPHLAMLYNQEEVTEAWVGEIVELAAHNNNTRFIYNYTLADIFELKNCSTFIPLCKLCVSPNIVWTQLTPEVIGVGWV